MDKASMTMLERLKEIENFDDIIESEEYIRLQSNNRTLIVLNKEMIYYNNIEEIENSDRFVFLSRHVSQSKKPTLTAHFLGNPSNDETKYAERRSIRI